MEEKAILTTLLHGNQLKRTERTGWTQRGVTDAESVADHTLGVCFTTLILASELSLPLDLGRTLSMAILHDLPEALTTDIPAPAWRYLPEGSKQLAEEKAFKQIFELEDLGFEMQTLWREMKEERTTEARLVHDADKIDLYLQALVYEKQLGNLYLEEFWTKEPLFYFKSSKALYLRIRSLRPSRN